MEASLRFRDQRPASLARSKIRSQVHAMVVPVGDCVREESAGVERRRHLHSVPVPLAGDGQVDALHAAVSRGRDHGNTERWPPVARARFPLRGPEAQGRNLRGVLARFTDGEAVQAVVARCYLSVNEDRIR